MGLLIGLVVGLFRANYWQTVVYVVLIGVALGVGTEVLSRFAPETDAERVSRQTPANHLLGRTAERSSQVDWR